MGALSHKYGSQLLTPTASSCSLQNALYSPKISHVVIQLSSVSYQKYYVM